MNSVGHVILERFTARKIEIGQRKKGNGETRRVRRKPRERKTSSKKGQRLNEITEPPEKQVTRRSWEHWSDQSWNAEADIVGWREDDWCTTESNSQASAAAEKIQHAFVGEIRLSSFGFCPAHCFFQL